MMWEEVEDDQSASSDSSEEQHHSHLNFDFLSLISKPKDFYQILEVDYDASEDTIRSNYIRLALKWHPDKQKDQDSTTSRFQEINEAYQGNGSFRIVDCHCTCYTFLSDPVKRREYDKNGMLHLYDYNIIEYLNRYKGLILTCNGLGMRHSIW